MIKRLLIVLLLAGNAMGAAYTITLTGASGVSTVTPKFTFSGTIEVKVNSASIKYLTSGVEDSISLTVGQTLEYVCSDWESITVLDIGDDKVSGDISSWTLPTSLITLRIFSTSVSGDVSGWTLSTSLIVFYVYSTSISGDVSGWTLPSSLTHLRVDSTSVSGDVSGWTLPSNMVIFRIFSTSISGDVSGWTLSSNMDQFYVQNTSVDYNSSGGAFTGITNSLTKIDFDNCTLTSQQVDDALADLVTSGITGKDLDIGDNNSGPSCVGDGYKDILVGRSWTVKINAMVGDPCPVTYYVDDANATNDTGEGTEGDPWKSIPYTWSTGRGDANDVYVVESDTIYFKDGDYGTFQESRNDNVNRHVHRNDWITYQAAPGHRPSLTNIYVHNAHGDGSKGESYLKFVGFDVSSGTTFTKANYIYISDCNITALATAYEGVYAPYYAAGSQCVNTRDGNNVTVIGCTLIEGYRGINAGGGNDITYQNNIIHGFAEDGIAVYGNNLLIENNQIYDANKYHTDLDFYGTKTGTFEEGEAVIQAGTGADGIWHSWEGTYGQIFQTTGTVFTLGGGTVTGQTSGATVSSVTKVDYSHNDGIQIGADDKTNIVIRNNIIHGIGFQGLKLVGQNDTAPGDHNNTGLVLENNLIYDVGTSLTIDGYEGDIVNNTFIAGSGGIIGRYGDTTIVNMYNNIMETTTFYSNAIFTNHGNNIFGDDPNGDGDPGGPFIVNGTEEADVVLNALFNDMAGNDFTLIVDSLAVNFGNAVYAPATDLAGNSRVGDPDAGCYEYIGGVVEKFLFGYVNN